MLIFIFILLITGLLYKKHIRLKNIGHSLFGLLYISLSGALMISLYSETDMHVYDTMYVMAGYFIPVVIIASIWINDTMAYIIGSFIGKTPLSKVSPKKTWEGTISGIVLTVVVVGLVSFYGFHFGRLTYHLIIIATLSAIAGTFGDLLESKLKRMAGVKDSGTFMPGHGGFLDRFDSMLLAVSATWLYVFLFVK